MNIDTIQQDMSAWNDQGLAHVKEVESSTNNRGLLNEEDLIPNYIKTKDESIEGMISAMNSMLHRI